MERSLHHVADLPEAARSAVEGLVGHPLDNDDVLYIATLGVQAEPSQADRNAAWDEVEAVIGQMQRNAAKSGLSSEQIDALLDAECAAVRAGRRT
jgi:hypothetical protein